MLRAALGTLSPIPAPRITWNIKLQNEKGVLCALLNGQLFGVHEETEFMELVWLRLADVAGSSVCRIDNAAGFYKTGPADEGSHISVLALLKGEMIAWTTYGPVKIEKEMRLQRDILLKGKKVIKQVKDVNGISRLVEIQNSGGQVTLRYEEIVYNVSPETCIKVNKGCGFAFASEELTFENERERDLFLSCLKHECSLVHIVSSTDSVFDLHEHLGLDLIDNICKPLKKNVQGPESPTEGADGWTGRTALAMQISFLAGQLQNKETVILKLVDDLNQTNKLLENETGRSRELNRQFSTLQARLKALEKRSVIQRNTAMKLVEKLDGVENERDLMNASKNVFQTKSNDLEKQVSNVLSVTGLGNLSDIGRILEENQRLKMQLKTREMEKKDLLEENSSLRGAISQLASKLEITESKLVDITSSNNMLLRKKRDSVSGTSVEKVNDSEWRSLANSLMESLNEANKKLDVSSEEKLNLHDKILELEKLAARWRR